MSERVEWRVEFRRDRGERSLTEAFVYRGAFVVANVLRYRKTRRSAWTHRVSLCNTSLYPADGTELIAFVSQVVAVANAIQWEAPDARA